MAELTLADHAEAWWREKGNTIPPRDTDEWKKMYETWANGPSPICTAMSKASERRSGDDIQLLQGHLQRRHGSTGQTHGIRASRPYGYYVLIDPPVKTEARRPGPKSPSAGASPRELPETMAAKYRDWQRKGYWGCPCGSGRQRRDCCGSSIATN